MRGRNKLATGAKKHPLYGLWKTMRGRCNTPTNKKYPRYGGRGISICARWDDFFAFAADMGPRPAGFTLDRINNDGDYEPANCRWASSKEQSRNKSDNRIVMVGGAPVVLADVEGKTGIKSATVRKRIAELGWTPEEAVSVAVGSVEARAIARRKLKSHCNKGHSLDGPETTIRTNGYRVCLVCERSRSRLGAAKRRAA